MMKVFLCRFHKSLGLFHMLIVKGISEMVFFKEWSKQLFLRVQFKKSSSYENHLFFQNVSNFIYIPEIEKKHQKKLLLSKIVKFQSGTKNSYNPEQHICHWKSMCYETALRFNMSLREIFSK